MKAEGRSCSAAPLACATGYHLGMSEQLVVDTTERGLRITEFVDLYGAVCHLQESSLATDEAVWLGVFKDLKGDEVRRGRMHLNREQVAALIPLLQLFVDTGRIG